MMLATLALLISTQTVPLPPDAAAPRAATAVPPTPKKPEGTKAQRARDAVQRAARSPVLTQGAFVASARGYVAPSVTEPGLMVFLFEERLQGGVRRQVLMMPTDPSDDVKALLASNSPDTPWQYEATGQVYDYKGRAFILPAAIVALRNPPLPGYLSKATPPELEPPAPPPPPRTAPALDAYAAQTAEAVLPPLLPSAAGVMPHERSLATIGGTDDDLVARLEARLDKGLPDKAAAKGAEPALDRTMVQTSGHRLQDRRAVVTRDPITGAWRAVLETSPVPDGPLAMEILPSRELEKMERTVQQQPVGTPWLLSGEIVVSGSRNYLLLTHARVMPDHRWMTP